MDRSWEAQSVSAGTVRRAIGVLAAYSELTKARLVSLVLFTVLVGYVLGHAGRAGWAALGWTMLGSALAALGANALNQWMEQTRDGRMNRTRNRPLPAGRLTSRRALLVSTTLVIAGPMVLALATNLTAAALAALAAAWYLGVYTPLKTRTSLCTLAGAVCGAIPPMIGWSAASGKLDCGAWVLAATLFVWQIPHFLALAWLYRDDYARGGFVMLPMIDPAGDITALVVILFSLALVPAGLCATLAGLAGWVYATGSVLLGAGLLGLGFELYRRRSRASARRLFLASVIYLPLLLGVMVADRGPVTGAVQVIGRIALVDPAWMPTTTSRAALDDRPS